ncbi:MAG: FlgD immunoglobulin-like domain containing protein [bacterium]
MRRQADKHNRTGRSVMCRRRTVPVLRGLGTLLLSLAIAPEAPAAPGDLDVSFGNGGTFFTSFGYGSDGGRAVAVQADGKLVVAGYREDAPGEGILLVRYNTDDSLDPTFGIGGKVITDLPAYTSETCNAMKIQADGKIVVGGYGSSGGHNHFLVLRYNADGTLDNTFSGDGIAPVDFGMTGGDQCWGLAIQSNGAIVAGGIAIGSSYFFAIARLNTNGTLDTSFDGDGKVSNTSTDFGSRATMTLQTDGKIVMAASLGTRFFLARYTTSGALDTSFDTDGKLTTVIAGSTSSNPIAVAVQPAVSGQPERIVAAGWALVGSLRFAVARYNLNGALDTTFDGDGMLTQAIGSASNQVNAILIQGDKITVAGSSVNSGDTFASILRFNLNGSLDGTFTFDYTTFLNAVPLGNAAFALEQQAGKIVLVGSGVSNSVNHDFMILKLQSNGAFDTSFDGDGIRLQDVSDVAATLRHATRGADGKIVTFGDINLPSGMVWAIARLNEDGSLDPSFASGGKLLLPTGGPAGAVAIQPDGRIVATGTHLSQFSICRFTDSGTLDPTFGSGALVDTPIGSATDARPHAVALQADGKIVVAGAEVTAGNTDIALVRYNPDGTLDTSFSGDGIVSATVGTGTDYALDVKIQSDGKIVVCGFAELGGGTDLALVRFLANGSIDNTFGSFGRVATDLGGVDEAAYSMVIQPDGKVVVAGYTSAGGYDFAVVRYNANGTLDTSFDGDGKVTTPIGLATDAALSIARQADGKLVVAGYALIGGDGECALVRYEQNGALDASYGFGGKAVVSFDPAAEDYPYAIMLDPQGRAIVAATSGTRFAVARVEGDVVTAAGDLPPVMAASRILHVTPNPSGDRQSFAISVSSEQPIGTLSVYNVAGQLAWRRDLRGLAPGQHEIAWDGRTDSGDTAASGVYFARLDGVRAAPALRLVRLR